MISQEDTEKIAEIFRLLGNPTRIKIIRVLGRDEVCVNDLAFQLNMTQSAVSHQLNLLRAKKVVKCRKDGKRALYSVSDYAFLQLLDVGKG
ncbi:ArsR/SmtB family transcription factor [Lachnospiraceae bacterium HCP1S3_C3]